MTAPTLMLEATGPGKRSPIGPRVVEALESLIAAAGLDASLRNRYSVVFAFPGMGVGRVYPDLAGCTLEVCTFIDEAGVFAKHGINVVGLSGEKSEPPEGCLAIPFPVGVIEQDGFADPIAYVEQDGRRYAQRASFVIFPDGSGIQISGISDVAAHVRSCLELVVDHRLERFRQAAISADLTGLRSTAQLGGLLPNGADSVAITRVDVTVPLVVKMAAPNIVRDEAGYMRRINAVLEEAGRPRLFPAVLAVADEEEPAWYLMEAADPVSLDRVLFADPARTVVNPLREPLLNSGIDRLSNLYELTLRHEVPPVARYHYRDRFAVIPARADMQLTHQLLVGGDLEELLRRPALVDGFACRPYRDQLAFLEEHVDDLAQAVGAYLHGDAHLPNMLISGDDSIVFVDPRIVWDGNDVGDPGFGDPLYDFATLLHSLHVMSAILYSIESGETGDLLASDPAGDGLDVSSSRLVVHGNPVVDSFRAAVRDRLGPEVIGANWEARLHVGTANALVGWLKYARSIQTREAWLAIFISVLYHLEVGRRLVEGKEI
ncbi:MAG: phosphotransferase [Chloroflexota bacterium]|nr:phosphotransferase [Chloroflexota bacterium]